MLVKEYRCALPLTLAEYRIAQRYMVDRNTNNKHSDTVPRIDVLVSETYTDGPGGSGLYTRKRFHLGAHLPAWIRAVLPKTALLMEEEAWNAYPYTRTKYTCPFVEKFFVDVETIYAADAGTQENIFNLSGSEARRPVEHLSVIATTLEPKDYNELEDPAKFVWRTQPSLSRRPGVVRSRLDGRKPQIR
eukprot:m.417141 g.417141  ORF g.417141 m.417141 type:complete len:189 (-) comp56616_c0_seq1:303-869(-)